MEVHGSMSNKLESNKVTGSKVSGPGVGGGLPSQEHKVLLQTIEIGKPTATIEFTDGIQFYADLEISFSDIRFSNLGVAIALGLQFKGAHWYEDYSLSFSGTRKTVSRDSWKSLLLTDHMPIESVSGSCWMVGMKRSHLKSATFQTVVKGRDEVASFHGGGISNITANERIQAIRLLADPLHSEVMFTNGFAKIYGRKD